MKRLPSVLLALSVATCICLSTFGASIRAAEASPESEAPVEAPRPADLWTPQAKRALKFAQQDAARARAHAEKLQQAADDLASRLAAAQEEATRRQAAEAESEPGKESDDKAKPDAKQSAAALEEVQRLTEASNLAAEKASAAAQRADELAALAEFYSKTPPVANPAVTREIASVKHDRPMMSCQFDPAGFYLYAGAQDAGMHRWDPITGDYVKFDGHRSWIRRFTFHDAGRQLITGGYDGQVILWKAGESPEVLRKIAAHSGYCRTVALSPDATLLASGGNDKIVRIWSMADGSLIRELEGHTNHIYNIRFHPSGKSLVSGDLMGVLKVWEVGTWKNLRDMEAGDALHKYDTTFRADCGGIRGMSFSPDGKQLVVGGIGKVTNAFAGIGEPTAVLYDYETGKRLKVMTSEDTTRAAIWGLSWHPEHDFIVAAGGGSSGALWFWKPGEEKPFQEIKLSSVAYDVAVHPDGLRLSVAFYDQTVRTYTMGPKTPAELQAEQEAAKKAAPKKK